MAASKTLGEAILVPEVYTALNTRYVLVTEWVEGVKVNYFVLFVLLYSRFLVFWPCACSFLFLSYFVVIIPGTCAKRHGYFTVVGHGRLTSNRI